MGRALMPLGIAKRLYEVRRALMPLGIAKRLYEVGRALMPLAGEITV